MTVRYHTLPGAYVGVLFYLIISPSNVYAWGSDGHQTVAYIAQQQMAGTKAEAEIQKLLLPGESLARISTYLDEIKDERLLQKLPKDVQELTLTILNDFDF